MNKFDTSIIHYINGFAQRSRSFDYFIANIVENQLLKGAVLVSVLWFFWFQKSSQINYNRERIIIGLVASIVAIAVSRILTLLLPFRERPFTNSNVHFVEPYFMQPNGLGSWSSFPSDHAILFFALSASIFLISKKLGVVAYIFTLLVICVPRIYFGYHFPTDILGGAIIGTVVTFIMAVNKISDPLIQNIFKFSSKYTGIFYVLFFLLTYQIANCFENSVNLIHYLLEYFRNKY